LGAERHGIEMPGKAERQFSSRAADTRDELRPPFTKGNKVDGETRTFEQGRQSFRARTLGAGRIDRFEPYQLLRQFD
jgi:hypothetical protein